jgi:hypothetical protein
MAASGIEFHRLWIEQCAAAQRIRQRFGLGNALEYLVGENLLRFVETAEHNPLFAQERPSFIAEIKRVFRLAEVGNYALTIERTKRLSMPQRATIRAISSISRESTRLSKADNRISPKCPPLLYRSVLAR